MQWILGLALAAAVFIILKRWGALTPEKKKDAAWKTVLVVGGALLLFMVLTGRVHVITAAIAAVIPLLRKVPSLLKYAPALARMMGREIPDPREYSGQQSARTPPSGSEMSEREACEVLGVEPGCPKEDVIAAHRRLIQKLHPDRGGNDYLAAKINEAKQVLLKNARA
ncbi:molecular chaperone DnaJ [Marinobacter pelagius]|uniref:DnaJ domain-containing protein n=1 Tax=Marinobacter sp. C7 TaxID=2951363 RepID=UPI001EF1277B|nr:DnaJ domain-containing protein [Marinobacter sp. C7]MCG7198281.1 molecular chaperone DnaJ [Marinobacter sp. C7]